MLNQKLMLLRKCVLLVVLTVIAAFATALNGKVVSAGNVSSTNTIRTPRHVSPEEFSKTAKVDENLALMPKNVPALVSLAGYPVELFSFMYDRLPTETEYWNALNELPWDMSDFKNHVTYKLVDFREFNTKWTWFKDKLGEDVYYESTNKYEGRVKPGDCDCDYYGLKLKKKFNWSEDEMHQYFRNKYIGNVIANLHWVYTESKPAASSIEELESFLGLTHKPNYDYLESGLKLNLNPNTGSSFEVRLKDESNVYSEPYRFKTYGRDQMVIW